MVQIKNHPSWRMAVIFIERRLLLGCSLAQELVEGRDHAGLLGRRYFDLEFHTGIFNGFRGVIAKCADNGAILFIAGKIVVEAFYAAGCKETDHVKILYVHRFLDIVADGPVHEPELVLAFICFEPVHDLIVLLVLAAHIEEFFVLLVFVDDVEHAFIGAICAVKHLAFAVKDELLEVEGDGFGDAEIFGVLADGDLHLFAHPEKMVDGIAAGEHHGRIVHDIDLLFAELTGGYAFEFDEGMENQFYIVFSFQVKIGRFITLRTRLRNQDTFGSCDR